MTQATAELLGSSACLGADCLMKLLGNYCRNLDIKTAITVGVVGKLHMAQHTRLFLCWNVMFSNVKHDSTGFPNVGKSSLINSLKRARACNIGATPGVTK